ncbi:MAG: hypothetical protein PUK74_04750 [Elusimicrobia bacterium]|nr:hypothetical protein [Elusimicrobiota bacterium]MDY5729561.1 hypothetical protein [Elusimicrobiaceae bacterium]
MAQCKRFLFLLLLVFLAPNLTAGVFTSKDAAFTLDAPSGWAPAKNPPADSVLSLQRGSSRLDIKTVSCTTETCLEKKINDDLLDVKSKKMQVVGNSYTGEEIKRVEFSTGEPFFYISFFTPKNDFSAGYFLINSKAYSVLAKDVTYAEADLLFSFISPVQKAPALEMNLKDPRAYDIAALPGVEETVLEAPAVTAPKAGTPAPKTARAAAPKTAAKQVPAPKSAGIKAKLAKLKVKTLLAKNMPPYIRQLGRGFDVLVGLICLFVLLEGAALAVRLFVRAKKQLPPANPNSLYPILFKRLYGTPSLIFRAKDNQGNVLISLSARWDSLFLFSGLALIVLTLLVLAVAGLGQNSGLLPLSAFAYNTLYSACSLAIPLGCVVFFCGVVWSQLVLREITLFDRKGKKAAILLQKGFGLLHERYEIYFARSKDVLVATRKRFALRRQWQILTREGAVLADISEPSALRSLLRKCCGHLWGFLRADYRIAGPMDSLGQIDNAHAAFDRFVCNLDKPQALNARDLLAVSLLINIRDKDKWYPWFN